MYFSEAFYIRVKFKFTNKTPCTCLFCLRFHLKGADSKTNLTLFHHFLLLYWLTYSNTHTLKCDTSKIRLQLTILGFPGNTSRPSSPLRDVSLAVTMAMSSSGLIPFARGICIVIPFFGCCPENIYKTLRYYNSQTLRG